MKSAWWEKRWVCRTAWCSVSPSPVPAWAFAAWVPLTRDRWRRCGNPTRFFREEFAKHGLEGKVWQYFTVVPDFKSTGVRDNARTFDWPVILRAVQYPWMP